jgi:hypothetical protein
MATVLLPRHDDQRWARLQQRPTRYHDALQDHLIARHGIQIPIFGIAGRQERYLRLSAQVYNAIGQYVYLAAALAEELDRERQM